MTKRIVLTGASSGIGKAFVKLVADEDVELFMVARSKKALDELTQKYPSCKAYPCDLMDIQQVEDVFRAIVRDHPDVDVLINNAGVGFPSRLDCLSLEDYEKIMDTNVKGLIFLTRNIYRQMKGALAVNCCWLASNLLK